MLASADAVLGTAPPVGAALLAEQVCDVPGAQATVGVMPHTAAIGIPVILTEKIEEPTMNGTPFPRSLMFFGSLIILTAAANSFEGKIADVVIGILFVIVLIGGILLAINWAIGWFADPKFVQEQRREAARMDLLHEQDRRNNQRLDAHWETMQNRAPEDKTGEKRPHDG